MGSSVTELIDFFSLPNPCICTIALGFTQPPIEMSTRRYLWGGKVRQALKADILTAICGPTV
jgi:hypothetical protein